MNMQAAETVLIRVTVNGQAHECQVEPRLLLVELLRETLDLTGTHIGCDTSYCGACTVLLNGVTVKSCTVFAVQAHHGEILSVEGLSRNGELHPLQKAFASAHGLQCGYCTPGMLLSAYYLLSKNPRPTRDDIRKAIAGNTCRCTGYQNVLTAIEIAAGNLAEGKA
jgi:carbon-monoxide dehydrogenase small subunit